MSEWIEVMAASEVPEGRGKTRIVGGVEMAIFSSGGKVFALRAHCPHRGGPLGEGSVEGGSVFCPLHGWEFRLEDGGCVNRPDRPVRCHAVEVRDGKVFVSVESCL